MKPTKRFEADFDLGCWVFGVYVCREYKYIGIAFGPILFALHWESPSKSNHNDNQ